MSVSSKPYLVSETVEITRRTLISVTLLFYPVSNSFSQFHRFCVCALELFLLFHISWTAYYIMFEFVYSYWLIILYDGKYNTPNWPILNIKPSMLSFIAMKVNFETANNLIIGNAPCIHTIFYTPSGSWFRSTWGWPYRHPWN